MLVHDRRVSSKADNNQSFKISAKFVLVRPTNYIICDEYTPCNFAGSGLAIHDLCRRVLASRKNARASDPIASI